MCYFGDWFKEVCDELKTSGRLKTLDGEFNDQVNDHGRLAVLYKYKDVGISIRECYTAKSNEKSEQFRNHGNKQYSRKEFNDALSTYSNSIQYGIENSKELSLAYANRSVVLYAIRECKLCEVDIDLAFKNGYPSKLHYKLYERLGKCYLTRGKTKLALSAFKNGLSSLKESELEVSRKNELAHLFSQLCEKSQVVTVKNIDSDDDSSNYVYTVKPPKIAVDDLNETFPCASKAFTIVDNANEGRHAVASRDIPVGETIIIEKAFTSLCLPSSLRTHCYNCLSRYKVSYPCRTCASVRFCSLECENTCWNNFHCYECKYLDLLTHNDIGLGHLALKMIIQVGLEGLYHFEGRNKVTIEHGDNGLGTNESGVFEPSDYFCVYSLVANSELRLASDLFRRSILAIYLCNILTQTGFIKGGENMEDDYCLVGSHLLKQIQMLPCNAHEVSELQSDGDEIFNSELKEIGSAVYTTLSLFNHSCDPSVVRHCYNDICVLRSIKYIKKGEPIIDNYGHLYPVEVRDDRQKNLQEQYYFTCSCVACVNDWPLYNGITQEDVKFICPNCAVPMESSKICSKCHHKDHEIETFEKLQTEYQLCMEDILNSGDYVEHLPVLIKFLNLLSRKAVLPVIHFNNCQEVVKLCFGLQGNYVKFP